MADPVEVAIASDPRWLGLVRSIADEFARQAGFEEHERRELTVAVSEAVSNVIKHAYRGDASKRIVMCCRDCGGGIELEIRHTGQTFDPGSVEIRPPNELRPGGRGLYLMRTIMDELEYGSEGEVSVVRMKKLLKTPAH